MSGQGIRRVETAAELRQAAWNAVSEMSEFTAADVCGAVAGSEAWGRKVVREWLADGVLETLRKDRMTYIYRVRPQDGAEEPSAYAKERQRPEFAIWRTMRQLRRFKVRDVHLTAHTEETPLSEAEVQKYATTLAEGGFLKVCVKGIAGKRDAVYQIVGRPGPFPPRMIRVPAIYDPNEGEYRILERRVKT